MRQWLTRNQHSLLQLDCPLHYTFKFFHSSPSRIHLPISILRTNIPVTLRSIYSRSSRAFQLGSSRSSRNRRKLLSRAGQFRHCPLLRQRSPALSARSVVSCSRCCALALRRRDPHRRPRAVDAKRERAPRDLARKVRRRWHCSVRGGGGVAALGLGYRTAVRLGCPAPPSSPSVSGDLELEHAGRLRDPPFPTAYLAISGPPASCNAGLS